VKYSNRREFSASAERLSIIDHYVETHCVAQLGPVIGANPRREPERSGSMEACGWVVIGSGSAG
jgi:hypothetical protein